MVENAYLMKNTLSILSLPTSTSANESSNWDKNKNNQCRLNWPSGRTGSSMNWHLSHPIFNETTYVGNLVSLNYLIQPETFGVNHPTQARLCSLC